MQSHRSERFVRKVLPALMVACLALTVVPVGVTVAQDAPTTLPPAPIVEPAAATLEVTAIDAVTGMPLGGCMVTVGNASALTSPDGLVALPVASGWFEIEATAEGFQALTLTLQMAEEGQDLARTLVMAPSLATGHDTEATQARIDAFLEEMSQGWDIAETAVTAAPEAEDMAVPLAIVDPPNTIRLVTNGVYSNGSFSTIGAPIVVTLGMDEYLKGVVPREVGYTWPAEALKAQAVAARCYASTHINRHTSIGGDVCNTVHCQAWSPTHYGTTDAAVDVTSGEVVRYDGAIISAFFFGHCDGNTRNSEDVWVEALPYCRSVPCECGYTTMYGHGVGMCQRGAQAMAERGAGYHEILGHYYTDTGNQRVWGSDRYSTSVDTARLAFDPDGDGSWPGVTDVIIASGEDRAAADPLAAAGLSWAYDAPILLTHGEFVPSSVRSALAQMASSGPIRVHVVGGTYTVPDARLTEIRTALGSGNVTFDRVRSSGNRYDLAATIALRVDTEWERRNGAGTSPGAVLFANGADSTRFFDALALSPIAAHEGFPILLVESNAVPSATSNVLGSMGQGQRIVGGGPATVSNGVVSTLGATRVSGKDRYLNALAAADYAVSRGWLDRSEVGVAAKLPDALCAGATMGRLGGVSLITDGQSLTPAVNSWVSAHHTQIENLYIFGGPVSVTGTVDRQLAEALGG